MARYECERCHEVCFTTNPPHICKDLVRRLERENRQIDAVEKLLNRYLMEPAIAGMSNREIANEIVKALKNLGLNEDV